MAQASKTMEFDISAEKFWNVIVDYEKYPEFVDTVKSVEVISKEPGKARVKYNIELLGKDIHYELDHFEDAPRHMKWEMIESNIFKSNDGSWEIESLSSDRCRVTYSLGIEFKIYVPGMILSGLVKSSLPKMLEQFHDRSLA